MGKSLDDMLDSHSYSMMHDFNPLRPYLRLRLMSNGKWAIVRVMPYQTFGTEVIATGLTRVQAEKMIALAKEE